MYLGQSGSIGRSVDVAVGSSGCGTSFDLTRVTQTFCNEVKRNAIAGQIAVKS